MSARASSNRQLLGAHSTPRSAQSPPGIAHDDVEGMVAFAVPGEVEASPHPQDAGEEVTEADATGMDVTVDLAEGPEIVRRPPGSGEGKERPPGGDVPVDLRLGREDLLAQKGCR